MEVWVAGLLLPGSSLGVLVILQELVVTMGSHETRRCGLEVRHQNQARELW